MSEKRVCLAEASSFYVQKVSVGGVFRIRGAEGGCGSFRHRCFSGKSPLSDGLEDRAGKNAFSSVLRVVFSSPVFSYFCIFFLYSSARCSGRIRSSCLRAKPFRICPAFCLPNYELTPISESMCESPFRCRCVVAEDAGFARKRVDYMIDVIRKTPLVRNPNRRGKVVGEVFIPLICGSRVRVIWVFSYCLRRRPSSSCACLRTASSVCSPRPSSYRCLWRAFRGAWRR